MINCTEVTETANTISTIISDPLPEVSEPDDTAPSNSSSTNNTYVYSIAGLEEYTSYSCTITARNIFGTAPLSEAITVTTGT